MNREVQRYSFQPWVPAREIENTLLLAVMAAEGLHGASQVQLDAAYCFDAERHACAIDVSSVVGRNICRIFGGFVMREFGEMAFEVSRTNRLAA